MVKKRERRTNAFRSFRTDSLNFKLPKRFSFFKPSGIATPSKASIVRKSSIASLNCDPFASKDPLSVYGKEFTKETFMEIMFGLFDPYSQLYKQRTQTLAMKHLSYLNGISYGANFENFRQGPGISEINTALKSLGFTKAELQKLIWKKPDPKTGKLVFDYKQTKKEWIKLLYDKITGYSPNDGSVYARQRDLLLDFASRNGYDIIDENSLTRNREEFTVEEAKMAVKIFESAIQMFGHFTIRLMFANMVDYYGEINNFGVKIVNRPPIEPRRASKNLPLESQQYLRNFLVQVGLIPSTNQYDTPLSSLGGKSQKKLNTVTHLLGYFLLESHIYLSIEGIHDTVKTDDNTLQFGLGPLVALTASGGFSGNNLRGLSKIIATYLGRSYELYRSNNLDPTNINIIGKEFLNDQSRTLELITKKIKNKVIDGHYFRDNEKNIWLANQLIEYARLGLIFERKGSKISGYLRSQLDTFMDASTDESRQNVLILKFSYKMPKSGKEFTLEITQKDLVENYIKSWADRSILKSESYDAFRAKLLTRNNDNVQNYLKTLINTLGQNKQVKIFLLSDTGKSDEGYKFINDPNSYFAIDLNEEQDLHKLLHIINLLYTGKFAFVMKKPTGTWNDGEMICAFNRDGFIKPNELYSSNMVINDYSTIFRGDNDKWRSVWIYPKAWSSDTSTQNNDFHSYINYLTNTKLDNKYINGFIRKYMELLELRYSGYAEFLKRLLGL